MQVGPAQLLGADLLAGGGPHQRRSTQENGARTLDVHHVIGHGRDVGSPGGAQAHDGGNLGNTQLGHHGLVVEHPPAVVDVGKQLALQGQEGSARIDQVYQRQAVFQGDGLATQHLLDAQRVDGAALDAGVVGHYQHLASLHPADTRPAAGTVHPPVVHVPGGQWSDLQKGRIVIQQQLQPFLDRQLAQVGVAPAGLVGALRAGAFQFAVEILDQDLHVLPVGEELVTVDVDTTFNDLHARLPAGAGDLQRKRSRCFLS